MNWCLHLPAGSIYLYFKSYSVLFVENIENISFFLPSVNFWMIISLPRPQIMQLLNEGECVDLDAPFVSSYLNKSNLSVYERTIPLLPGEVTSAGQELCPVATQITFIVFWLCLEARSWIRAHLHQTLFRGLKNVVYLQSLLVYVTLQLYK